MNNFIVIILDGVGVGELPDADLYGDKGSNTLANISKALGSIQLPNLQKLGIGNIIPINGIEPVTKPLASFGKMTEVSKGKDSTTGHWEISGLQIDFNFDYFPNGFPDEIIKKFIELTGVKGVLGNKPASGTEIISELGDEHIRTGYPIVYTSADSVFQIAAHEEHFGLDNLYRICEITRNQILTSPLVVGRVIARPFIGKDGNYSRTTNRKDYSLNPPSDTILDYLQLNGINTIAIGKIDDLFNHRGINVSEHTKSNSEGMKTLLEYVSMVSTSFIFVNLVDFDVYFGHRNDPKGFYEALRKFDDFLPHLLSKLNENDRLIITADHGNDPTTPSTDHSREYVPLLFYGKNKRAFDLGTRKTFADVGKTVAEYFKVPTELSGESFLNQ
ncbi:Phosphopentomutase [Ignavibacterium album JCM 16511]|uniref:Phosphopentomutase n=1 Tax=Ignavibacterium album (strain DSM 19864 / JCM 16511 / NBRC 101810 / Mat9-16) TaxID=945713 RepID=I0AI48_IGNAJ|nr:phosphopentomutase [Ignavibacterium album]AFH48655.1 Phosphopentomutase [Ignavibacterium album JCM 16511]